MCGMTEMGVKRNGCLLSQTEISGHISLASEGVPAQRLWALGPIVRGVFWECLAVPDIRVQGHRIVVEVARQVCR